MTKGRGALPFGVMVVMTASRTPFIRFPTCRRQVRLLLMTRAEGWVRNGPTQAKRRLEWATHLLLVQRAPCDFSLNLPQASQLLGMTKGRVALPFKSITRSNELQVHPR